MSDRVHEEVDHAERESHLGPDWGERERGRRCNSAADVDVDDEAEDGIERRCEALHDRSGLRIVKALTTWHDVEEVEVRTDLHRILWPPHL